MYIHMDFEWVSIALGDVTWVMLAFLFGFLARLVNLPPLVGFLVTGFVLNYLGFSSGDMLQKLADLGITLLLFTVGLKLNLKVLIRPQVWAVTAVHVGIIVALFGSVIFVLALLKAPLFSALDLKMSLMLGFALSFSSTVFVVKVLEEKGEVNSLHGRIAIGILVMQDLAAVIFLASSSGKLPSPWAISLFLLIPARPLFHYLLQKTGHGELLILYGLVLALGGAELFELGDVKGDLGALIMGVLISTHVKSNELAKAMLGFKDLFLVGFFLTIGLSGDLSLPTFIIGLLLVPLLFVKSSLLFLLLTRFKLRARTSLLATFNLSNYSEFGLIVTAIGVKSGWLDPQWLVVMAIAVSISFIIAAPLNRMDDHLYNSLRHYWVKFQTKERLIDDLPLDTQGATIAIFGMGRIGSGAYDKMKEMHGDTVVGVDFDTESMQMHESLGRKILRGDPSDSDFWDNLEHYESLELVMLALPNVQSNLNALEQLQLKSFSGKVVAIARFTDEVEVLTRAGASSVFNIYAETGTGFANHVEA